MTRFLRLPLALGVLSWCTAKAGAEELQPFSLPEEPSLWDSPEFGSPDDPLMPGDTPPLAPESGATPTEAPAQPAVPPEPELVAPAVDAYLDVSFTDADFGALGYDDTTGGYRFIAGFQFEKFRYAGWALAPEVGYLRIGRPERELVEVDLDGPPTGYVVRKTTTETLDSTSLDFGVRASRPLAGALHGYARAGLQVYHAVDKAQVVFTYEPKPGFDPRDPEIAPTTSRTDVGTGAFLSLGLAVQLGPVPSLYIEYGTREFADDRIDIGALGVLMNF